MESEGMNRRFRFPRLSVLILVMSMIAGVIVAWWMARMVDRDLRKELLTQAQLVARPIDVKEVRGFSGSEADTENPAYLRLKERFSAFKQANGKCRFIYLLGRKVDGSLFFYLDNEPPDSKNYSPPGQVYAEASPGYYRVFNTLTPAVEGPAPDRWGTWVTGLVPLIDPTTGESIAVLGMDVDASVWKWDVAARAALPIGVLVVLLLGVAAFFFSSRRIDSSPKPVMRRLIFPLAAVLFLLIGGLGWLLVAQWKDGLNQSGARISKDVLTHLPQALMAESQTLSAIEAVLVREERLRKSLGARDREGLLSAYAPVFETLGKEHAVTHFYFMDPDRVCLLRLHQSERYNDPIDRYTARAAERTGKTAAGIELGPLGTFTLRVVRPVFDDGSLIGYLELGKEIEDILYAVHRLVGVELGITLPKQALNRENWEAGMKLLGREAEWDRFKRDVLSYSTLSPFPTGADAFIDPAHRKEGEPDGEAEFNGSTWRIRVSPLQDVSGATVGELFVFQDITASKAAHRRLVLFTVEVGMVLLAGLFAFLYILLRRTDLGIVAQQAELIESEERHRAFFEKNRTIQLLIDPRDGMIIAANAAACKFYGYTAEEMREKKLTDINTFSTEEMSRAIALIRSENRNVFHFKHRLADGQIRDVEVYSSPIFSEGREWLYSIVHDVTARNRAEAALTGQHRLMRVIFDTIPGYLVLKDRNGVYQEVNSACAKFFGKRREEMIGRRDVDLFPSDEAALYHLDDDSVMGSGKTESAVKMVSGAQGERWFYVIKSPVSDGVGNMTGLLCFGMDITEQRRTENALFQAQKMESVGRLAGGVAHDFNNILNVILGHAELAMDKVGPDHAIFSHLQQIHKTALHSADLTRQLLGYARKQAIRPQVLDLNKTVNDMLKMLVRVIGEDIDLSWRPGVSPWAVRVDPAQIGQILVNLCINARDAITDVGKITIETENIVLDNGYCEQHLGFIPGRFVLLAVSDNGCGIGREFLDKLFEPFFTTKEEGKGTGLGLATVYGIVKQNGGFINVYSEPGEGTTFKVYLPRHEGNVGPIQPKEPMEPIPRGHEVVLLVEDDPANLKIITMMLESLGYTVLPAATSEEGIARAAAYDGRVDLLMTDVIMPEMNGRDLAVRLKALYPELDCLFMSGYTANVIAHRGILDEGVQFIQKPFSKIDLSVKLREVLTTGRK